jgi:hypothetical protein
MKLCSKLLVFAILATTCFALISCAGPTNASSTYKNVSISLSYYPICNGCGTTGTGGFTYGVNPPGAGGITGAVICSPASSTCLVNGTELCSSTTQTCVTGGAIEMPPGGGSGSCVELYVTVTNAPLNPTFTILPAPVSTSASSNVGTLGVPIGNTVFYCEASGIPIYSGAQLAQAQAAGLPMGTTEVVVTNPADPNNPSVVVSSSLYFSFQLLAPPTGLLAGVLPGGNVTVPLGGTFQFTGYIAGNSGFIIPSGAVAPTGGCTTAIANTCIPAYQPSYLVNGVIGGAGTGAGQFGTISSTGLYTAPTAYPSATVHSANITVTPASYPSSSIVSGTTTVNFP